MHLLNRHVIGFLQSFYNTAHQNAPYKYLESLQRMNEENYNACSF